MLKRITFILLLSLGFSSAIANTIGVGPNHQRALESYEDGKRAEATNLWLTDAYNGYTEAAYRVAVAFLKGDGVAENHYEALYWLRRSATVGDVQSQLLLGKVLVESGETKNIEEGIDWWLRAAKTGNDKALLNYAVALDQGVGVIQDRAAARQWLKRSIQAGSLEARRYLDLMTTKGSKEGREEKEEKPVEKIASFGAIQNDAESINKQSEKTKTNRTTKSNAQPEEGILKGEIARVNVPTATLHNTPGDDSRTLFNLTEGILVTVLRRYGDWVKVYSPAGLPSWLKKRGVKIENGGVYKTKGTQWVYSSASGSVKDRFARLPANFKINVVGQSEDWFKILAPNWVGAWVRVSHLEKLEQTDALSLEWQDQESKLIRAQ